MKNSSLINLGRLITAFLIFILSYLVWGCSAPVKEYYPVYKEVYIPVTCRANIPVKPIFTGEAVTDNLNILKYAELLKEALELCK